MKLKEAEKPNKYYPNNEKNKIETEKSLLSQSQTK